MNTIGHCIINNITLSVEQADEVCRDLNQLDMTGIWGVSQVTWSGIIGRVPTWAVKLAQHYRVAEAHSLIQLAGWKAAAKAYQCRTIYAHTRKELEE